MAGVYPSGWPAAPVDGVLVNGVFHTVLGAYNSDGLRPYRHIDLRARRNIATSRGGLSFFVEMFNVLGFADVTASDGYTFNINNNSIITGQRHTESILGMVPTFGATYGF